MRNYRRYNTRSRRSGKPEMKVHDLVTGASAIAAGGTIIEDSLNIIAQGTRDDQRIGRRATIHKIMFRGILSLAETTTIADSSDDIRFIIFQDRQTNGAAAAIGDIMDVTLSHLSFRNLNNSLRFKILSDTSYHIERTGMGNGTANDLIPATILVNIFLDVHIVVQWNDTVSTGALTSCESNNIGVLLFARKADALINGQWRLRFTG